MKAPLPTLTLAAGLAVGFAAPHAAADVMLTPGTWNYASNNGADAGITSSSSSQVTISYDGTDSGSRSNPGVWADLDQAVTLSSVGDFIQVKFAVSSGVWAQNKRDDLVRVGFLDATDVDTNRLNDPGFFGTIKHSDQGQSWGLYSQDTNTASDILGRNDPNDPSSLSGVTKHKQGTDIDWKPDSMSNGVFRLELLTGDVLRITYSGDRVGGTGATSFSETFDLNSASTAAPTLTFDRLGFAIGDANAANPTTTTFGSLEVTTNIPEPASLALAGLGGVLIVAGRRRKVAV